MGAEFEAKNGLGLGTYGRRRQSSIDVVGRHVDARRLERRRVVIYQP